MDTSNMNSFERQAFGIDRDQSLPRAYATIRSDGKYKVIYCFSAKRITKIHTKEKLDEVRASGKYEVFPK